MLCTCRYAMQCQNCVSTRITATITMQTTQPSCFAATHSRKLNTIPATYCHLMQAGGEGGAVSMLRYSGKPMNQRPSFLSVLLPLCVGTPLLPSLPFPAA